METIITPKSRKLLPFKEIWQFRELLYFLAWRDIKVRYKQTAIGVLWAVLQPFLVMIVFTFLFNKVIGVSSGNIPYPVFIYSGLLFWNYFSASLQNASDSLVANQSIITKVFFPRIIIPVSTTIVPLVDFFFAFLFFVGILLYFHVPISPLGVLYIIPALFFSMITSIGLGGFLAVLNVQYRDVRYALPFFIQLLLFVTPVIYPVDQIPTKYQFFLYLNPLTGIIESVRVLLLQQHYFPIEGTIISVAASIIVFFIGVGFFIKYESRVADVL